MGGRSSPHKAVILRQAFRLQTCLLPRLTLSRPTLLQAQSGIQCGSFLWIVKTTSTRNNLRGRSDNDYHGSITDIRIATVCPAPAFSDSAWDRVFAEPVGTTLLDDPRTVQDL